MFIIWLPFHGWNFITHPRVDGSPLIIWWHSKPSTPERKEIDRVVLVLLEGALLPPGRWRWIEFFAKQFRCGDVVLFLVVEEFLKLLTVLWMVLCGIEETVFCCLMFVVEGGKDVFDIRVGGGAGAVFGEGEKLSMFTTAQGFDLWWGKWPKAFGYVCGCLVCSKQSLVRDLQLCPEHDGSNPRPCLEFMASVKWFVFECVWLWV